MKRSELREIIREELKLIQEHRSAGNTVKDLINLLKKFPSDWEVKYHERGGMFDSRITRGYQSAYDKKRDNNIVTISNE